MCPHIASQSNLEVEGGGGGEIWFAPNHLYIQNLDFLRTVYCPLHMAENKQGVPQAQNWCIHLLTKKLYTKG